MAAQKKSQKRNAPKKNVKRNADPQAEPATSKRSRGKGEQLRTDPEALGLRSEPRDADRATNTEAYDKPSASLRRRKQPQHDQSAQDA